MHQFWNSFQGKIALDSSYTSIEIMRLQLFELQENNKEVKSFWSDAEYLLEGWEDDQKMFQY